MNDLKLTLYDLFAFLLPGCIAFVSLAILGWSLCAPNAVMAVSDPGSLGGWAFIGTSYVVGHMLHPIANRMRRLFPSGERAVKTKLAGHFDQSDDLVSAAQEKVRRIIGATCGKPNMDVVLEVAIATVRRQSPIDYDVFQYREGFYRGLTVAFGLMFVSLVVRAAISNATISLNGVVIHLTLRALVLTATLAFAGMILSLDRYRRFSKYRVWYAFMSLLVNGENSTGIDRSQA